jgi:hypothetical protein
LRWRSVWKDEANAEEFEQALRAHFEIVRKQGEKFFEEAREFSVVRNEMVVDLLISNG